MGLRGFDGGRNWETAIEAYRNSHAHKEIVRHTRGLKGRRRR
jgi:hypothetical protein